MLASIGTAAPRRHALRRAVRMECAALSALWDDEAPLVATDLSPLGIWLSTELPLEVGEELVLTFRPPHWPILDSPVTALAKVVRVGLPRRRGDQGPPGMGLRFTDIDADESARMSSLLRGLPPPLPVARETYVVTETCIVTDGLTFELCAEAELLTSSRPPSRGVAPEMAATPVPTKGRSRRRVSRVRRREAKSVAAHKPHLRLVS